MKNILPRDEYIWLLVTESVRAETDGKMSLFGFLGTEKMQIPADTVMPTGILMTLVFVIREGIGTWSASFQIRDPKGDIVFSKALDTARKPSASENLGIAVTIDPFVITSFGTYRLSLTLDGRTYKRTLTIEPDRNLTVAGTRH